MTSSKDVILSSPLGWKGYDKWVKSNHPKSKSSSASCKKHFATLSKNVKEGVTPPLGTLRKVDNAASHMKKYVAQLSSRSLADKQFYAYLYSDAKFDIPCLSRMVVHFKSNHQVSFTSLTSSRIIKYEGTYELFDKRLVTIDLKESDGDRRVHLKLILRKFDQKIILGTYSSYSENWSTAISGALVLMRHGEDNKSLTPARISFWDKNKTNFESTPKSIREYLSRRKNNYYKVPDNILTEEDLKRFVIGKSKVNQTKHKFIEYDKPIVFISAPGTSDPDLKNYERYVKRIVSRIKEKCKDISTIEYSPSDRILPEDKASQRTLSIIKKTNLFVLFICPTSKATFSLVQLGWALAYCKKIIIYHQRGCLSERIEDLKRFKSGISLQPYEQLEEDAEIKEKSREIILEIQDLNPREQ